MKKTVTLLLGLWALASPAAWAETEVPARIISLGPVITQMIYLLEADDRLVADTIYCNFPEDARRKPRIGSVIQVDVEKIISLGPDIVLANPLARERQLDLLRDMGIRVVRFENPATFGKICQMMDELGRLLGKQALAEKIISQARAAVDDIIRRTSRLPARKVFIQIGFNPLHTSPRDTFINEYITFGGGINVAADEKSGNYSREKVLETNPDVILIATMGSDRAGAEKERQTWLGYPFLNAARTGEIHILDPDIICSPTPVGFVRALTTVAELIHPGQLGKSQ